MSAKLEYDPESDQVTYTCGEMKLTSSKDSALDVDFSNKTLGHDFCILQSKDESGNVSGKFLTRKRHFSFQISEPGTGTSVLSEERQKKKKTEKVHKKKKDPKEIAKDVTKSRLLCEYVSNGIKCKMDRDTFKGSSYCKGHNVLINNPDIVCKKITSTGLQCTMSRLRDSDYCSKHDTRPKECPTCGKTVENGSTCQDCKL